MMKRLSRCSPDLKQRSRLSVELLEDRRLLSATGSLLTGSLLAQSLPVGSPAASAVLPKANPVAVVSPQVGAASPQTIVEEVSKLSPEITHQADARILPKLPPGILELSPAETTTPAPSFGKQVAHAAVKADPLLDMNMNAPRYEEREMLSLRLQLDLKVAELPQGSALADAVTVGSLLTGVVALTPIAAGVLDTVVEVASAPMAAQPIVPETAAGVANDAVRALNDIVAELPAQITSAPVRTLTEVLEAVVVVPDRAVAVVPAVPSILPIPITSEVGLTGTSTDLAVQVEPNLQQVVGGAGTDQTAGIVGTIGNGLGSQGSTVAEVGFDTSLGGMAPVPLPLVPDVPETFPPLNIHPNLPGATDRQPPLPVSLGVQLPSESFPPPVEIRVPSGPINVSNPISVGIVAASTPPAVAPSAGMTKEMSSNTGSTPVPESLPVEPPLVIPITRDQGALVVAQVSGTSVATGTGAINGRASSQITMLPVGPAAGNVTVAAALATRDALDEAGAQFFIRLAADSPETIRSGTEEPGNSPRVQGDGASDDAAAPIPAETTFFSGTTEDMVMVEELSTQPEGLLAGFTPLDPGTLGQAMQQVLSQLEDVGGELASLLSGKGLYGWLLALATGLAAYEFTRRHRQRLRAVAVVTGDALGGTSLWFPGFAWQDEQ